MSGIDIFTFAFSSMPLVIIVLMLYTYDKLKGKFDERKLLRRLWSTNFQRTSIRLPKLLRSGIIKV